MKKIKLYDLLYPKSILVHALFNENVFTRGFKVAEVINRMFFNFKSFHSISTY